MLEKLQSSYMIQKIFSNMNERIKLKLIKYNKRLQKAIDIDLLNYKLFSRKYIIYESKGRGKEYDEYDTLLYEGEFLKGERYGRGKEYN